MTLAAPRAPARRAGEEWAGTAKADDLMKRCGRKAWLHRFRDRHEPCHRQIEATDKEIDGLVYELYGLIEKEIGIVEEETK